MSDFTTGYQANLSVVSGICGPEDHVLLDAACHASIYDGARLSQARTTVFRHNSSASLSRKLERLPQGNTNQLVVVEALYSLTGDLAPLAQIAALCRQHGAYLLVDEAHSLGAYGAGGRGWSEAQGILPQVDFIVGTFSKALASDPQFVTGVTGTVTNSVNSSGQGTSVANSQVFVPYPSFARNYTISVSVSQATGVVVFVGTGAGGGTAFNHTFQCLVEGTYAADGTSIQFTERIMLTDGTKIVYMWTLMK